MIKAAAYFKTMGLLLCLMFGGPVFAQYPRQTDPLHRALRSGQLA